PRIRVQRALPRIRVERVEAAGPLPELDFAAADEWHVALTLDEVPRAALVLPSPGAALHAGLVEAAIVRHADPHRRREQLISELRGRLGARARIEALAASCSVVVCTHRRPEHVPRLLA